MISLEAGVRGTFAAKMLARFVASSTAAARAPIVDDALTIEDVRAVVRLRDRRLVVGTELGGGMRVVDPEIAQLPHRAQTQLAFHDVASGRCVELDADELFVFDIQTVELLPDAPGFNDPLYLYGVLRGPYPQHLGGGHASVDGQLTVTRGDLLHGLVTCLPNAFVYAPDVHGSRCVHALLPGARADEIERGRGLILAMPLPAAWTFDAGVSNDRIAAQLVYDVVTAMRAELGGQASLPVPSRAVLERQLVSEGWRIDGDHAERPVRRGALGKLFGRERRALPREGTLDEIAAEAATTIAKLPGLPTAEARALARRGRGSAEPFEAPVRPSPAAAPAPPPSSEPRPRHETPSTEWMRDFIDAHHASGRNRPRVSAPSRICDGAPPPWLADFTTPFEPDEPRDDPPPNPDWSKDFE